MPMTSVPLGDKALAMSYRERNGDGPNGDGKSKLAKSSDKAHSKQDRSPVNSKKIVYPPRLLVDFNSLHIDALNKYVAFYSIPVREEYTKDDLAALVARHFDCSLEVEEDESILSFVTRVRNGEKTNRVRPPAPKNTQSTKKSSKEETKPTNGSVSAASASAATSGPTSGSSKRARDDDEGHHDKEDEAESAQPPPPKKKDNKKGGKGNNSSSAGNDDNELYCVCNLPGYGSMIACDGKQCPNPSQWYHLECVGFSDGQHPDTWFCPECDPKAFAAVQKKKKKNRSGGGGSSSSSGGSKDKSKDSSSGGGSSTRSR
ncbi:Aste57867_12200 [Aphanomyces stellatus]|uniref:Aste57867_12200 protein n=1 Tax=Aphanomyces stellatus TaxID=120398 RepID=A0A485KUZ2_9STRA|nr:hypothetical protein As57867_012155 [Aphanomyces stellatus]VFT89054.1 Aste57867_12200 [Aphanomyces stellatus]